MFSFSKKAAHQEKKDWATQLAEQIEQVIDSVRDKAVVPLTTLVRGIVYGTLILLLSISALVLISVFLFRLLNVYLHNVSWMPDGTWVVYLILGGIFVVLGLYLWSMRTQKQA